MLMVVNEDEPWCGVGTMVANDAISREVAKSLEPTSAIVLECIPFEKGSVKSVGVINEFLKILQGNLGSEGRRR
jgi:hypothetical protein